MSTKLRFNCSQDLFEAFPSIADAVTAQPDDTPSIDYLRGLVGSQTPEDAITFCAYLLPRREAVWWGHQCLQQTPGHMMGHDIEMLELVENWVREPEEERRQQVLGTAMSATVKTPSVWIGLGAGWSGGNMVADDSAHVPPPPYLTATAINAGILSLLARIPYDQRGEELSRYVEMGIALAEG